MKKGTPSDGLRLVNDDDRQNDSFDYGTDAGHSDSQTNDTEQAISAFRTLMQNRVLFIVVSAACATAAIAAGSYAVWLSRKRFTQDAIMDVHDLLETCNDRMRQMEKDLSDLPSWKPAPKSA